jgi:hypothetical protein
MTTQTTGGGMVVANWDRLDDGSWGLSVRCGGHGAEMVGQLVTARRKDRSTSTERLGALVQDYGHGDVCVYRVQS